AEARGRLTDAHLRLGGGVLGLHDLLLRPEGLDLGRQAPLLVDQGLLLLLELGDLRVEALQLALDERLALEGGAGEILAVRGERLAGLAVELDDALLELRRLKLQSLLRRDDGGDAARHL